ncbi:MAG: hypothetical protein CMH55_11205 [Myxococcales bacterium]|nr:hypothetical protein [Myxococcales bacterium]
MSKKRQSVVKNIIAKGEERVTEVREQIAKSAEELKDKVNSAVESSRHRGQDLIEKINIGKAVDLETLKNRLEGLEQDLESLVSDLQERIGDLSQRVADLRGARVVTETPANEPAVNEAPEVAVETAADLAENTVVVLRTIAAERNIDVPRRIRKAELINLILANN